MKKKISNKCSNFTTNVPNSTEFKQNLRYFSAEKILSGIHRIFYMIFRKKLLIKQFFKNINLIAVIGSIIFVKPLKQLHHAFLILLATCDLGVMAMQCFQLLGTIFGDTFLPQHPVLCELSGMVCMTSCFGSLWTMMFIAINR